MASGFNLPPPAPLAIHDQNAADKWKKFRLAWTNYALAAELGKKSEAVQVATLLTVIGEEARDVYSTFTGWADEADANKLAPVLQKFAEYCQSRKNVPFERYRFNRRTQEAGESYDQYKTALRKLAASCDFDTITPDEMLRDHLVFGIRDSKVRERLLRESNLSLTKTDEICRASESMQSLMKMLVVSDYYSNYIEVACLNNLTSRAVIKELKAIFARFGVPDTLVTDNGAQFSSAEFAVFATTWMFEHKTSSPTYPQSNGKAEKAVQTVKNLFKKCKASGTSEFQALLDWRNTPTAGIGTSPAQRLMGRRCKTLLPIAGSLLQPSFPTEEDTRKMLGTKQRQQFYYNKHAKPLEQIRVGDAVRMRLPGEKTWSPGTCTANAGPRSFRVQVGETVYRRNRRQILKTGETPEAVLPEDIDAPEDPTPTRVETSPPEECPPLVPTETAVSRRPQRNTKPPAWFKDYVTS